MFAFFFIIAENGLPFSECIRSLLDVLAHAHLCAVFNCHSCHCYHKDATIQWGKNRTPFAVLTQHSFWSHAHHAPSPQTGSAAYESYIAGHVLPCDFISGRKPSHKLWQAKGLSRLVKMDTLQDSDAWLKAWWVIGNAVLKKPQKCEWKQKRHVLKRGQCAKHWSCCKQPFSSWKPNAAPL